MPLLEAAIVGGAALAGGIGNAISQGNMNKKNRRWSEKMYNRQKADNLEFWAMQNAYNSPQEQMKRFQAAGLNPNLIYGQGNSGPAGAVSTPDIQNPQTRAPEWGGSLGSAAVDGINAFYDTQIKQATANNLEEQNNVLKAEKSLKDAQTLQTLTSHERGRFDLNFERDLIAYSAQARKEQVRKLSTDIDLSIREDARRAAQNSTSLEEAAERMMTMRLQRAKTREEIKNARTQNAQMRESINIMRKDGVLKQLEINLREDGINPNDPMYQRILGQALDGLMKDPDGFSDKLTRYGNNLKNNLWNSLFGN